VIRDREEDWYEMHEEKKGRVVIQLNIGREKIREEKKF
jgi:hypothetical protein